MKIKRLFSRHARLLPFCFLLIGAACLTGFLFFADFAENEILAVGASQEKTIPTVILDAGHGGMDPGAISQDGILEKDLNLAVSKKLGAFLESAGIRVLYTRTQDCSLESDQGGSRKTRDLLGRVEMAKEHPDAIFISIHMNTLPIEKYSGFQAFYSDRNEASARLAAMTQEIVSSLLQPDNKREAKESRGSIFILDRIDEAAVLLECGFLSNREEAKSLNDPLYQDKLSYAISRSILEFISEREKI